MLLQLSPRDRLPASTAPEQSVRDALFQLNLNLACIIDFPLYGLFDRGGGIFRVSAAFLHYVTGLTCDVLAFQLHMALHAFIVILCIERHTWHSCSHGMELLKF